MNKKLSMYNFNKLRTLLVLLIILTILSGCSVKFMSSYDENTDKAVTQLQKNFETFFVTLESQERIAAECKYSNHKEFYQDSTIAISAIDVRAKALDKNEKTVEQIGLLNTSLNNLELIHKIDCLDENGIKVMRNSFNSIFIAILKLELGKKRGS